MKQLNNQTWTAADSASLYGIDHWGGETFSVTDCGDVQLTVPFDSGEVSVPLPEIIQAAQDRGHELPLLVRVENLLDARIALLNDSFSAAIAELSYQNRYNGVFPIKVNQQAAVIEEIGRFGARYGHGLEAGSKPELLLCLASLGENGLLICNGYKDREFIDLGLWARKLGHRCFFVIESPAELPLIIERSRALGIRPLIGLRIKISAKVGGLWTETTGDRSSFGLTTAQLTDTVDRLRTEGMLDCLQLLHCHLGSQIPHLEEIKAGVREACRFYTELCKEGVPLGYIDLGGGLAVDYVGNRSGVAHSCDYSVLDYCRGIVSTIAQVLDAEQVAHPVIVTESGRATVAHTTMLFFNIIDVMRFCPLSLPQELPTDAHPLLETQFQLYRQAETFELTTGCRQTIQIRDEIRELFRQGEIGLRQRSMAENLFLAIAGVISRRIDQLDEPQAELEQLRTSLADIYYGNFSVFQSLPDTWAIGQLFPVMPIHRLGEYPEHRATISDLTCDCDGNLDRFIIGSGESPTLPLHGLKQGEDYILGVFMMGAYQETLGDLHNLFGDTNVISVKLCEGGGFDVIREQSADSVLDVLEMLEYNRAAFFDSFRSRIEGAVRCGRINVSERQRILKQFAAQLDDQTYFKA